MVNSSADVKRVAPDTTPASHGAFVIVFVTSVYWLMMVVGTHLPVQLLPPLVVAETWDKWRHATAFGGLAALLCLVVARRGTATRRVMITVLLVIAAYAIIDEATQGFVPGRIPDFKDWLADVGGGSIGAVAFAFIREAIRRVRSPVTREAIHAGTGGQQAASEAPVPATIGRIVE